MKTQKEVVDKDMNDAMDLSKWSEMTGRYCSDSNSDSEAES